MPELGPDLCYACQEFLTLVADEDLNLAAFSRSRSKIQNVEAEFALKVCQECNWVHFDRRGNIILTSAGRSIAEYLGNSDAAAALRVQIFSMVRTYSWSWADALRYGRQEAVRRMPDDVRQCFEESEALVRRWNQPLIDWWADLAQQQRGMRSDRLVTIGRQAERLSVEHERKRTGRRPDWRALETTFDGYDILSRQSRVDETPLRIEVKGTMQNVSSAVFFVSANEWRTAKAIGNYVFHLWSLGKTNTLKIVDATTVEPHVPVDRGKGHWDVFQLRFGVFFVGSANQSSRR